MPHATSPSQPGQTCDSWQLKTVRLDFSEMPALMGIVNVTPDSFSDGGQFKNVQTAVDHALQLVRDGAAILDVGGESTRPYSQGVSAQQELERVIPVVEGIRQRTEIPISIDTSKATVARAAIAAGAEIINDVSGLTGDPDMLEVALNTCAGICAMHMQGSPQTMQDDPRYENVSRDIYQYLAERKRALLAGGIAAERICLDPGIGFGKTHEHNLELLRDAHQFHGLGSPILVGHSRKGFVGKVVGDQLRDRDLGTAAISQLLARQQIQVIRVHNVRMNRLAIQMQRAVELARF